MAMPVRLTLRVRVFVLVRMLMAVPVLSIVVRMFVRMSLMGLRQVVALHDVNLGA